MTGLRSLGATAANAGGLLLAVVVPILYLAIPVKDKGGYSGNLPLDRIAAHWVGVAAIALLIIALVRGLGDMRRYRRSP